MVTVDIQIPLNTIVACMFCGGFAVGEARRAPCTAKDEIETGKRINIYQQMKGEEIVRRAEKAGPT
jgi:hypothetical protein